VVRIEGCEVFPLDCLMHLYFCYFWNLETLKVYVATTTNFRRSEDETMPISATMVGALLGLGTQMYSNALRKLPYMRHPWEHVVGMGLGAVFANQLVKWDVKLKEDLDVMLAKARAANERRYFDEDRD
jgi:hypothetical protein